jgi:hypothetical protein
MFQTLKGWMGRSPKAPAPAPPSEEQEMRLLCSRIGVALLACQLVERNLHSMLQSVYDDQEIAAAARLGEQRPMLNEMIKRLKKRGDVPEDFPVVLDEFRKKRNAFVHSLLEGKGASVLSREGRIMCYQEAAEVHFLASSLMKLFGDAFAAYHTALGYDWPDPRAFGT